MKINKVIRAIKENILDLRAFGPRFELHILAYARKGPMYCVKLPQAKRFYLRKRSTDIHVLRKIFRKREYDLGPHLQSERLRSRYEAILAQGKTPLIIDAGANIGASAVWFSSVFPAAQVAAIEPHPGNYAMCAMNTRDNPMIVSFHAAIGGLGGEVAIQDPGLSEWGIRTSREAGGQKVKVMMIKDVVQSFSPNHTLLAVKVDIEGFESELFSHNLEWLDDVMAVLIEPHDWMLPGQFSSLSYQRAISSRQFEMVLVGENVVYVRA